LIRAVTNYRADYNEMVKNKIGRKPNSKNPPTPAETVLILEGIDENPKFKSLAAALFCFKPPCGGRKTVGRVCGCVHEKHYTR